MNTDILCLCGSGIEYARCCGPFHSGEKKPLTAVALMRARFTAYALHNSSYILDTWDAATQPEPNDLSQEKVDWQHLEICHAKKGEANDTKGIVEFKAYYLQDGQERVMHETSHFIKHADSWFYLDGLVKLIGKTGQQANLGRNSPCSCGSGKKFKRCCGVE